MDKSKYLDILDGYIENKKRKKHSISTANFMEKYAPLIGVDPEKSYIAGLLHDIGKYQDKDRIVEMAESYDARGIEHINYFDFKKEHPFLLHGVASAEILLSTGIINDNELVLAISHHTTGGADISRLAKYTFISDFCEPMRKYKESKKVRNVLIKKKDFERAYFLSYYYLIESLIERKMEICIESIEGYNDSLIILKNKENSKQ